MNVLDIRRSNDLQETIVNRDVPFGPLANPEMAFRDIPVGDGDLYQISPNEVGY